MRARTPDPSFSDNLRHGTGDRRRFKGDLAPPLQADVFRVQQLKGCCTAQVGSSQFLPRCIASEMQLENCQSATHSGCQGCVDQKPDAELRGLSSTE